jgi:hypothetical protein
MIRARPRALVLLVLASVAVIGAAALAFNAGRRDRGPIGTRPPSARPTLLLLTSLPLVFGEDFSLEGGGSAALKALETRYRVVPISVTDGGDLAKGRLLLMAHPLAQTAENLVTLDQWVRRGGRVMLLADPMLEWPSKRPLGDPLRPPPTFADTGLLAHWGLSLDAPVDRRLKPGSLGGYEIMTDSPGALFGGCDISADRLVAHCRVGKGQAAIVADADLLDPQDLGKGAEHNLDGILSELSALER